MTSGTVSQTVLFPELFDKPLVASFDRPQASSGGGAVLLKSAERVYGLVKAFARCLVDKRAPEKDPAYARGADRPARLWHRLRAPRRQRRRAARRRPDAQVAGWAGSGDGRVAGLAANDLAVREWGGTSRAVPAGARVGSARRVGEVSNVSLGRRIRRAPRRGWSSVRNLPFPSRGRMARRGAVLRCLFSAPPAAGACRT